MPFFSKDKKDKEGKKEKKQDTKNKGGKGAGVIKDESPSPARRLSNVNANEKEKQTNKDGSGGGSETSLESSAGASKISSASGITEHYQNQQNDSDTDGDDGTTEVKEALRALHDLKDDPQVAHSGDDESASTDADTDATSYITDATGTGTGTGATTDTEAEPAGGGKGKVQQDSDALSSAQETAQKVSAAEEEESEEGFKGFGSFKFESADHVDEYLKSLGVGLVFRKVQSAANPTLTIFPCKDDEWAIQMDSIFRTREIKFRLGKEFIDETYDGRPCRSVASLEGPHRLIMRQRCSGGSDVRMVYEVQMDNAIHIILISGAHRSILRFSSISDL